jgi:hypothetical protein
VPVTVDEDDGVEVAELFSFERCLKTDATFSIDACNRVLRFSPPGVTSAAT